MQHRPRTFALVLAATLLGPLAVQAQQTAPGAPPPAPEKPAADAKGAPDRGVAADTKAADAKTMSDRKLLSDNKAMASYKAFFDAKLAGLQAGLQLTAAQAPLWGPVEAAIRDLAKTHFAVHHPSEADALDARERLQRMGERLIRGGQAMKSLAEATGPLLLALDPDQKERIGKLLQGLPPRAIIRKAFDVAEERPDDDRFDSERPRPRMEERRRDDGDRMDRDGDERGDRERAPRGRRYDNGRDDYERYDRHHDRRDDDDRDDRRGSDRHGRDMDEERTQDNDART